MDSLHCAHDFDFRLKAPFCAVISGGQLILNQVGRVWQETEAVREYSLVMKLTISNLKHEDFTDYNCTAGNSLGTSYGLIKLQHLPTQKTTTTTPSPVDWRSVKHGGKHNNNNINSNSNSERDPVSGNPIKHSKNRKRKPIRNNSEHFHEDYDLSDGDIHIGDGLTTTSSLSASNGGGLSKRNQKEPLNTKITTIHYPRADSGSGSLWSGSVWGQRLPSPQGGSIHFHKCCLPLIPYLLLITSTCLVVLNTISSGIFGGTA